MANLMKELKDNCSHSLLIRLERGGKILPSGKRQRARYQLDESPFDEAERLAREHEAMQPGTPLYNPGKALEESALVIARKYSPNLETGAKEQVKPKSDPFEVWLKYEKVIFRAGQKIADAWDDLSKTIGERTDFGEGIVRHLREILLSRLSKDMRRKRMPKEVLPGDFEGRRGTSTSRVYPDT